MADVVKQIEITAALSADYQEAFKAATSIASSSSRELSALTKQETQLIQMLDLSAKSQQAASEGNVKVAERLASQYDKLAEKLGLVDTSAEAVAAELKKVGDRKKDVSELNASAKKSAAFGKLAKDIQTYTKAAKKTKDPAIIKQLDAMKKKFKEMGGAIPNEKKLGFFGRLKSQIAELPGPVGKVAKGFGGLSAATLAVGGIVAVGAAAVATAKKMWDLGVSTISTADAIAKTSKQLGIGSRAYQEFAWAVGLGGASEEDLATGLQTLNKQMEAAISGNARAQKAFKSLGISMDEVKSMNTEEMFVRISDGLASVQDTASKTKTVMDLFGGSGTKLAKAIDGGSAALEAMRQEARDAGYVLSDEDLVKAEKAADDYARAQMQVKGALRELGIEVMPTINEALKAFTQLVRDNRENIKEFTHIAGAGFKLLGKALAGVMEILPVVVKSFVNGIEYWQDSFYSLLTGIDRGVHDAVAWVTSAIQTGREAVTNALLWADEKFEWFKGLASSTVDAVIGFFVGIPDAVTGAFDTLSGWFSEWWRGLKDSASAWVTDIINSLIGYVMSKVGGLADSIRGLPLIGRLLDGDSGGIVPSGGGNVTIQVHNSIDARGASPGAGADVSRAVSASAGQTGQSVASALSSYSALSYAG